MVRRPETLGVLIETERLSIVPLRPLHAPLLFAGMQDASIYQWISASPPASVQTLEADWTRLTDRLATKEELVWLAWAVRRKSDGAWIGKLDADIHVSGVARNIGYLFFPPFWRLGYASEAVSGLSAMLAREGVEEQIATVTRENAASCRLLERIGFNQTCILPCNDTIRGVLVDDIEYRRGFAGRALTNG